MGQGDILLNTTIKEKINTGQKTVFALCGKTPADVKCISWKLKKDNPMGDSAKAEIKKVYKALKLGKTDDGIVKAKEKKTIRIGSITVSNNPTIVLDAPLPMALTGVVIGRTLGTGTATIQVAETDALAALAAIVAEADADDVDVDDDVVGGDDDTPTITAIDESFADRFSKEKTACLGFLMEEKRAFPAYRDRLLGLLELRETAPDEFAALTGEDKEDAAYAAVIDLDEVEGLLSKALTGFELKLNNADRLIKSYVAAEDEARPAIVSEIQQGVEAIKTSIGHIRVNGAIKKASTRFRGLTARDFFGDLPATVNELEAFCKTLGE